MRAAHLTCACTPPTATNVPVRGGEGRSDIARIAAASLLYILRAARTCLRAALTRIDRAARLYLEEKLRR